MGCRRQGREDGPSQTFWERSGDSILGAAALSVLGMGTVVYHLVEGWSWVDSFYFSSVAVTTVGFGDLTPSTDVIDDAGGRPGPAIRCVVPNLHSGSSQR